MTSRREFLAGAAAGGVGLGFGGMSMRGEANVNPATGVGATGPRGGPGHRPLQELPRAERPLDLLILGGTAFLGIAQVEYARARGHRVTLFNRGRTNPHLFPELEKLVGDRAIPDYSALEGRRWDAVLDNSASLSPWVEDSTEILRDSVGHYLFVSSISAHKDNSRIGGTETTPVFTEEDYRDALEAGQERAYGPNKAQAERVTLRAFGDGGIVVRPGLIVGPHDRSDRFTYWPVRIHRGGEVLAPGDGSDWVQWVDVRDLARFMVHLLEVEASGTYNATGPEAPLTMAGLLYGIRAITSADVSFAWVEADFLREHEVGAWMEMPLWVYPSPEMRGFSAWDCSKAVEAGLTFRPLADTARDTLEWWASQPQEDRELGTGLDPEKEARILEAWHARSG